jgi:hypothetical protein
MELQEQNSFEEMVMLNTFLLDEGNCNLQFPPILNMHRLTSQQSCVLNLKYGIL